MSKTYYICKMKEAKDGLGIVSAEYYNNPTSENGKQMKKFSVEIVFEGNFSDCLEKKKRLVNSIKNS